MPKRPFFYLEDTFYKRRRESHLLGLIAKTPHCKDAAFQVHHSYYGLVIFIQPINTNIASLLISTIISTIINHDLSGSLPIKSVVLERKYLTG